MKSITFGTAVLIAMALLLPSPTYAEEEHGEGHEEGNALELDAAARQSAGIATEEISRKSLSEVITIPAEIILNAYKTTIVTPRITAQVVKRLARLGDKVETGAPLVTLSSVAMAAASGELIVSAREWQRVKALGKGAVSAKRYTEAQVAQQQALSRVLAYGMSERQARKLAGSADPSLANGEFDLLSQQSGRILRDDFVVGELIEPGRVLFTISDESTLWVEAKALSRQLRTMEIGDTARVTIDEENWVSGTIIQVHHQIDETTRTQSVRIEIANKNDDLHPGHFARVSIVTGNSSAVISVPNTAITLNAGAASVFVLKDRREFHPTMIEPGQVIGDHTIIKNGLKIGDVVAVEGVFYLKSMMLKSTLGEGH